jgi:hypothetical protein
MIHLRKTGHNSFDALARTALGEKLWEFLDDKGNYIRLLTAIDLGFPPIYGVEEEMLRSFPEVQQLRDPLNDKYRRLAGYMVRVILEDDFVPVKPSRRRGKIFTTASTFQRKL